MKNIVIFTFCVISNLTVFSQYVDLPANIAWTGPNISLGTATVDQIETAYNYARSQENTALKTQIPEIDFPNAAVWATMNTNQKALWIINQERTARGILPLEGTAPEVIEVAQNYCQYLIDNDTTGHYADGHNPLYRLQQNEKINACMQSYNENIGYSYSNNNTAPTFVVERLIYWLIYEDAISNWGHRQNFFKSNFNDNSGEIGKEGLLGVGYVVSTSYKTYNYTAFAVFNIIDPCSTWEYPATSIKQNTNTDNIFVQDSRLYITHLSKRSVVEIVSSSGAIIESETIHTDMYTSSVLIPGNYIVCIIQSNGEKHSYKFVVR